MVAKLSPGTLSICAAAVVLCLSCRQGYQSHTKDTPISDASGPDASSPDGSIPDTVVPDTSYPDTNIPDKSSPDNSIPDNSIPDNSNIPDIPDIGNPDASLDTTAPSDLNQHQDSSSGAIDATAQMDATYPDRVQQQYSLSDLSVEFAAANSAQITWWPHGVPQDFNRYEIWYGTERSSVELAQPPAQLWGPDDDLNLAFLFRPAPQLITQTVISNLTEQTNYFVQLRAIDSAGFALATTQTIGLNTPSLPSTGVIDIYRDSFKAGSWVMAEEANDPQSSPELPYAGTESIKLIAEGGNGFVFHYGGLNIDISAITQPLWETAVLEFYINCTGGRVDYAEVMLQDELGGAIRFSWPNYYVCSPGYNLVQLPLAALRTRQEEPAVATHLQGVLGQFWLWGPWPEGQVYLDEVVIRY